MFVDMSASRALRHEILVPEATLGTEVISAPARNRLWFARSVPRWRRPNKAPSLVDLWLLVFGPLDLQRETSWASEQSGEKRSLGNMERSISDCGAGFREGGLEYKQGVA